LSSDPDDQCWIPPILAHKRGKATGVSFMVSVSLGRLAGEWSADKADVFAQDESVPAHLPECLVLLGHDERLGRADRHAQESAAVFEAREPDAAGRPLARSGGLYLPSLADGPRQAALPVVAS
jgi:hypothetical protein